MSNDADANTAKDPVPPPEVLAEILAHADRAKREPSFESPRWVTEVPLDEQLMAETAPGYDAKKLLESLTAAPVPLSV